MKKLRSVLLVDDDNINNFINERLIKKAGITDHVKIVLNGEEGINYLKEDCQAKGDNCPELILLDINMPVMDGFEFLEEYQKLGLDTKSIIIVMLTTSTNPNDTKRLENTGVAGFINKPLTEDKLKEVMDKYFGG